MNLIEYPWLNTCRHVLTAASWCAKLSKLHKKWDFWLSSPFHCLTAIISHFLEKTQDQKSLQKADLFRHFSQSLALFLLLFLSASCSGSKDIWLWEEEKQPPQIFVSLSYFTFMQTYHHQTISFLKITDRMTTVPCSFPRSLSLFCLHSYPVPLFFLSWR